MQNERSSQIQAAILTTGNEIVSGRIVDTNENYLCHQLDNMGVGVSECRAIRDDTRQLITTMQELINRYPLIIVSGGLGPTEDDITVSAIAQMINCQISQDETAIGNIHERYKNRGFQVNEIALRQAQYPTACHPLINPLGLAVGFQLPFMWPGPLPEVAKKKELGSVPSVWPPQGAAFFFPGVPEELKAMFEMHIPAWLESIGLKTDQPWPGLLEFFTFGIPEAQINSQLSELGIDLLRRRFAISFKDTIANIRLYYHKEKTKGHSDQKEYRGLFSINTIDGHSRQRDWHNIKEKFAGYLLPENCQTLAEAVHQKMIQRGETLVLAESCTGGWLAKSLVDLPGSSQYLLGGWVCYSNSFKQKELQVSDSTLAKYGSVSEDCVSELAINAINTSQADWAIAISGIAGPDGGSPEKPVGTVFLALAKKRHDDQPWVLVEKKWFFGQRQRIRLTSSQHALLMLLKHLAESPPQSEG